MLYKLSLSNIKKSVKDYTIYFFTLILGICIFYIFNSLDSQTAMLNVSNATYEIVELIKTIISALSIFVSCVLGFLIIFASRFLIKKRNKEFGIYMTLGMSKREISKMLLIETFLIGVISLLIGLGIGIALSQITSIFIANLFNADMSKYTFNFSLFATIKTLIYFSIIYIIVMIFNTIIINKCKLLDLLQASKKSEKVKLKNPILCIILFIISIICLAIAYYMVTDGFFEIFPTKPFSFILVPISIGVVGTVLFFWSISGMFLKIVQKCNNIYYKGLNGFIYKELSSQINTMVIAISLICIMVFTTICLLASALTIKDYFNNSLDKYAPADVEVCVDNNRVDIDFEEEFKNKDIYNEISELITAKIYEDEAFDYKKSLGSYYEILKQKYPYVRYNESVLIMSESEYNNISDIMKCEKINIKEDEYAIICNYERDIYDKVLELNTEMDIFGVKLKPGTNKTIEGDYWLNGSAGNVGFFVVSDNLIQGKDYKYSLAIANYKTKNKDEKEKLNDIIEHIEYHNAYSYTDKIEIQDNSVGLSAMATFIGLYLGIIFLISSAAIIALKSLSDAIDSRKKYKILREIGTDEKDINKAIFKQTLIFFILPLILAVSHTIFGIRFCLIILESMGVVNMLKPMVITCGLITLVYGGYFIITYNCNKNIMKERIY